MKTYLEISQTLDGILIEPSSPTGSLSGGTYGNIIVESGQELEIKDPIEMLPGAGIRVERGALLTIRSTITGACGQMWRGIIVEGSTFYSQTPANQGKVVVRGTGKIEHALCEIEVQDPDAVAVSTTGGGIVEVIGGELENNAVGIRYGAYSWAGSVNAGKLLFADFTITDDYRGDTRPVLLDVTGVVRLRVTGGQFQDLRTQCTSPSSRALGIDLKNAGLSLTSGAIFQNLDIGIRADKLTTGSGSFNVHGVTFKNCYTDILSISTGSFVINNNYFLLRKPDACPSSGSLAVTGVKLRGNTTGFKFSKNNFYYDGEELPDERLIGTHCENTGNGMDNVISENSFSNLAVNNKATNYNGSDQGLRYLCNTSTFTLPDTDPVHIDFLVDPGGTIKNEQSGGASINGILPTGNKFSNLGYSVKNEGETPILYYYYTGQTNQDPDYNTLSEGINPEGVDQPNCVDPCENPPCPEPYPDDVKSLFHTNKQTWLTRKAALPYLTNEREIAATKRQIDSLRLEIDKGANWILSYYSLDTVAVEVDSIVTWLGLVETYPADLHLARHYFFSGNPDAFDTLWAEIPGKYDLTDSLELADYDGLTEVYGALRPYAGSNAALQHLPQTLLDSLKSWAVLCSEPGYLSQVLLWRNGIKMESDCSLDFSERASTQRKETAELVLEKSFRAYPNPASESLVIEFQESMEAGKVTLFNLQGIPVLHQAWPPNANKLEIKTFHLPVGIYFAEIRTTRGIVLRSKIVISH